jgi:hypothetical protein
MFVKENASFQFLILANQHRGTPSVWQGLRRQEIFRLRGQIVFLPATPSQLQNLRQVRMDRAVPDEHFRGSWAIKKHGVRFRLIPYRAVIQLLTVINQPT